MVDYTNAASLVSVYTSSILTTNATMQMAKIKEKIFSIQSVYSRMLKAFQPSLISLNHFLVGSVYFTENSSYRSLKNHSCAIVFGSCSVTLTVGEPLGDVYNSANHDF